jgi:hypothetical protein
VSNRSVPKDIAIPETTTETTTENNSGADAPPTAPVEEKKNEKEKREPTGKNAVKAELQEHFCAVTGLPGPSLKSKGQKRSAGALWWNPLLEIAEWFDYDVGRAKANITAAVGRLRRIEYLISDPNSILKTARALVGETNDVTPPEPELSAAGTYGPVAVATGKGELVSEMLAREAREKEKG